MISKTEKQENKLNQIIKIRTGQDDDDDEETHFISYESCCSDQETLDNFFNNLKSEDPNLVVESLKNLLLICKQEPINITVQQFYYLLNIFTVSYSNEADEDDETANFIPNLTLTLINQIIEFPKTLLETIVTNDFIAPFLTYLPNDYLFTVIANIIPRREGIAEYVNEYGVIDILEPLIKSETKYTKSCLYLIRKLADEGIVKEEYFPLFFNIINETENEEIRRNSFKTVSAFLRNSQNCRNFFVQNIVTFIEFIDAFPMDMKVIFSCFISFLKCDDEEKILSLLSSDEIQFTARIIQILSSPQSISIFNILAFLSQASKYDSVKAFILQQTDLLEAIIGIAVNNSLFEFSVSSEAFKVISRVFTFHPFDVSEILKNGLFQAIIDFIPFAKGSVIVEILKAIINIIQIAQEQNSDLLNFIHENDTLNENLETIIQTTHHRTPKQLSETIIEFMNSSLDES